MANYSFIHIGRVLGALALLVGISACSSTGNYPAAPQAASAADYVYRIGALDTLNIVVWRNPELSTTITVRPDGRISLPLIDDLKAEGRTPSELSKEIEKALTKFVRDPSVSVVVSAFQGVYSEQIRIIGEAQKPQSVAFRQNMTLLDVMILAGGLTDFADGNGAVLVRGAEGGKSYSVRLKDLLKRGNVSANVPVLPGDIIIIPQSWF